MLLDDFLWRAFIGGLGVVLVAGPLGCFVVWRRMAYFGDTLAHSALLGVALGFLLGVDLTVGIAVTCIVLAVLLVLLQQQKRLATDTLLGLLAHASLAIGLVAISFLETLRVDLLSYLFGDMLAIGRADLAWIYAGALLALGILAFLWRPLLAMTVHEELAEAEGVPVVWVRLAFMLMIALVIAIAMKIVGILLITSLLLIPAATARQFARSPEQMALQAVLVGVLAVTGGLAGSLTWDTPTGPSVVVAAVGLFAAGLLVRAGSALLVRGRA
jgi:zinc transport system permease protein